MKKKSILLSISLIGLSVSSLSATNGVNMIGLGVESRAMGGVSIAKSFGASSGLGNAALLQSVKEKEVTGTVTFFMPDLKAKSNAFGATGIMKSSAADFSVIPELYYANRVNDNLVYGLVLAGTAGMGADYSNLPIANVIQMKTNLMLLKLALPISYKLNDFSVSITPLMQYGKLGISHTSTGGLLNNSNSDIGLGFELGLTYDIFDSLRFGAVYKSKVSLEYSNVLSKSIAAFGQSANITSGDKLEQPSEFGVGMSFTNEGATIALDLKHIAWANAKGYSDFGWENQFVIALGYEYIMDRWAYRLGYNYADSPISEQLETGNAAGSTKNFFNLSGFPGIVKTHYTAGLGYDFSNNLSYDVAIVYAEKTKESFSTSAYGAGSYVDVEQSQFGITIGANYKF